VEWQRGPLHMEGGLYSNKLFAEAPDFPVTPTAYGAGLPT